MAIPSEVKTGFVLALSVCAILSACDPSTPGAGLSWLGQSPAQRCVSRETREGLKAALVSSWEDLADTETKQKAVSASVTVQDVTVDQADAATGLVRCHGKIVFAVPGTEPRAWVVAFYAIRPLADRTGFQYDIQPGGQVYMGGAITEDPANQQDLGAALMFNVLPLPQGERSPG